MSQQNFGITVLISVLCGLIAGFVGGLLAPLIAAGILIGAASAAMEEGQEVVDLASQTRADMRTIGTCCELYAVDNVRYPDADSIVALAVRVEPMYVEALPYDDGWGNRFLIASGGLEYEIRSAGPDGTAHTDDDIVYSDGRFIVTFR